MDYSTTDFVVSGFIAEKVKSLLTGKKPALGFSYSVPATLKQTCTFCGQDGLFPCTDGADFYYLAEVEVTEKGERRAHLTKPHRCAELQRHEEFLNSPLEPEF
jgi:hypothetical protein